MLGGEDQNTSSHERLKRDSGTKRSTASKREEARVRSSLELLYGGMFTKDQLDAVGAKVDRVHEKLMAPSWNDVKTALKQEYKGGGLGRRLACGVLREIPDLQEEGGVGEDQRNQTHHQGGDGGGHTSCVGDCRSTL